MLSPDIRLIAAFSAALLVVAPQDPPVPKDPPKVTYEDSGDFRLLVMDLERRFKGRVRFEKGIPSKEVSISVRDAGYFEALDALCRAHKGARYIELESYDARLDETVVGPGEWIEHPSSYSDHFKTAILSMTRMVYRAADGNGARVTLTLAAMAPPWIPLSDSSGATSEWKVDEARDKEGKDLLAGPVERYAGDRAQVGTFTRSGENSQVHFLTLSDFDLSRGLKVLAGTVKVRTAEARVERIAVEEGLSLEMGAGTLTVEAIAKDRDLQRDERAWKISFSFKGNPAKDDRPNLIQRTFEGRLRHENGKGEWIRFSIPEVGHTFSATTSALPSAPAWVEFRIRGEERLLEIPFKFVDVSFKEK